jgi:hypothetical protein
MPELIFGDPYVKAAGTATAGDLEIRFPRVEAGALPDIIREVRRRAREVFAGMTPGAVQEAMGRLDAFFADRSHPEVQAAADLIHRIDGFSRHDIARYGLGIFEPIVSYDRGLIGRFPREAFGTRRPVETAHGYLRRFGGNSLFVRRREPGLLSHFVSGNVAGYTAILTRIGLPLATGGGGAAGGVGGPGASGALGASGAAQLIKLPSTSAVFPMIYLSKMAELAPEVRATMACGYWRGGDRAVEDVVLAGSDTVNVLGSEATVRDIERRLKRMGPRRAVVLGHGHKVGAAYVSRAFAASPALSGRVLDGLVRDISAFDGCACYSPKNIYVQGDPRAFANRLLEGLARFAGNVSPVNPALAGVGRSLRRIFAGSPDVLAAPDGSALVRVGARPAFWFPDESYRYVQVMPVESLEAAAAIMGTAGPFLQTVVAAVPDAEILPALELFGRAGASNVHYPGSAPLLNVYEEPHDGDFDYIKIRYPYRARFAATNFKRNADWLR